jgi:predicted DNA-binding transcriptional regulator AlpA
MERQEYRDDDLLTKSELARALKVSVRTIDRYVSEGGGPPYVRIGRGRGQLRWRWGDVLEWLREHRVDG